jgi:hydrogenase expression/formation protein HypE
MTSLNGVFMLTCPIPISDYPHVLMAHGGGGRLMNQLIRKMFVAAFDNERLNEGHDGATFPVKTGSLAMTTDSYVVQPLFFPGGDIGQLAINGTVNDLAMCGARPLYLSVGFILEEGLPMETLWRVVQSMQTAALAANVQIVTGDTKVVDKGKGDGSCINTAGVGVIEHDLKIAPQSVQVGDAILLSGDIGRHGVAIMAQREGLEFESEIKSDSAPVADLVLELLDAGINVRCLRDLTRGGLASALVEIAQTSNKHIHIDERAIPVRDDVRGACEILGLDPLYIANEGRFIAFVQSDQINAALAVMKSYPVGEHAQLIGRVTDETLRQVTLTSAIGARRIVDMLSGEQLPRIC